MLNITFCQDKAQRYTWHYSFYAYWLRPMNHSLKTSVLMLGAAAVLASSPAFAQDRQDKPAVAGEIKLNPQLPVGGTVQTDILPGAPAVKPIAGAPGQGVSAGSVQPGAAVPAGLPTVPGVQASAETAAPAAEAAQADEPLTKNFVPGQPVPTYATLADAAAAGVEPLPQLTLKGQEPTEAPAKAGFNWKDPHAYMAWLQAQLAGPGGYAAGGGFVLLGVVWLWLRNRRANAAWEGTEED